MKLVWNNTYWVRALGYALADFNAKSIKDMNISDVNFRCGPPHDGWLPLYICINGEDLLLIEFSDVCPSFMALKAWMERVTTSSFDAPRFQECTSIDCEMVLETIAMFELGTIETAEDVYDNVALFLAHCGKDETVEVNCICRTDQTIQRMYNAVKQAFDDYKDLFDDEDNGVFDIQMSGLRYQEGDSIAGTYKNAFCSQRLEDHFKCMGD